MGYVKVYRQKKVAKRGEAWDEQKKLDVVRAYILLGQLRLAAASCGVPEATVKVWRYGQWWRDAESELRRSSKLQLSSKLSTIVEKALQQLDDRLTNGDYILDKHTGAFVRKPVSAEHASKIASQLVDKTLILEKAANTNQIDEAGLDERIAKLKRELTGFASKPKQIKVIEGDYTDVPTESSTPESETQSTRIAQELKDESLVREVEARESASAHQDGNGSSATAVDSSPSPSVG